MSGCAYYDHFDNRVGTYDVVAAQSRDAMILTNVIRASHAEPLSFVQLGQINGSGAAGATAGLPSLILGPHVTAATSVLTHTLQNEAVFGANPAGGSGFIGNQANGVSPSLSLLCRLSLAGVDDCAVGGRPDGDGLLGEPVEEQAPGA